MKGFCMRISVVRVVCRVLSFICLLLILIIDENCSGGNELTEEEEKLLKEKEEYGEERSLFSDAFEALCVAQDEKPPVSELLKMITLWEKYYSLKAARNPNTYFEYVSLQNLSCVTLQFFNFDHKLGT
jgi:hypothetical protein